MIKLIKSVIRKAWPKAFYRRPHAWVRGSARVWMTRCGYHRRYGPAIEYSNGTKSWYYHGAHYLYEDSFGLLKINEGNRVLRR